MQKQFLWGFLPIYRVPKPAFKLSYLMVMYSILGLIFIKILQPLNDDEQ